MNNKSKQVCGYTLSTILEPMFLFVFSGFDNMLYDLVFGGALF
jgi:hypothetical protein